MAKITARVNSRTMKGLSSRLDRVGTSASSPSISRIGQAPISPFVGLGAEDIVAGSAMDGKQSLRAPGEDHRHEHEDHHAAKSRWKKNAAKRIDDAYHQCCNKGATD